jgi:hypothetical protein
MDNDLGTRTHPMVNTAMIGAFARIMASPPIDAVMNAIKADISIKPDKNVQAALQAYESVTVHAALQSGKQERAEHWQINERITKAGCTFPSPEYHHGLIKPVPGDT